MSAAVSIRKQLPWRRAEANLSQEELAEITGISRNVIANIEAGRRDATGLTVDELILVCHALGCYATDIAPQLAGVLPDAKAWTLLVDRLAAVRAIAAGVPL